MVNTFAWYKQRCDLLSTTYDPMDQEAAMNMACKRGHRIPIGIIYRNDRLRFEEHFPVLRQRPLVGRDVDRVMLKKIMEGYS